MPAQSDLPEPTDQRACNGTSNGGEERPHVKYAKYKGDICISGISGRVTNARNMKEFRDLLRNKGDGFLTDVRRFDAAKYDLCDRFGYMHDVDKFDNNFFEIPNKAAEFTDPYIRLSLEAVYECLVDAGVSMAEIKGSRTGVYFASISDESQALWNMEYVPAESVARGMGTFNCFKSARISYFFDLKGPSIVMDVACSSFFGVMEYAIAHIRSGVIDQAILAGCKLILNPIGCTIFKDNGAGSKTGKCWAFDAKADGFARGECVGAMLIQKEPDSKRIYGTIVHCTQATDGNGDFIFGQPSLEGKVQLLKETYEECQMDPLKIDYVECHGTGTAVGDLAEVRAICEVFCTKGRKGPVLIGSVKSNVGHAEDMAGFNSVVKVLFAMEDEEIAPNIHFDTPNPNIPHLTDGRVKVITELTPWTNEYGAICSYGLGGNTTHTILRKNTRPKPPPHPASDSLRLFTYCARTEEGLKEIFKEVQKNAKNVHYQALLQETSNVSIQKMPYRGYTLLNADEADNHPVIQRSTPRPLVFLYTGMGGQWLGMGKNMLKIDIFKKSVQKYSEMYKKISGMDIYAAMCDGTLSSSDEGGLTFASMPVIQMALTDMLFELGLKPDYILGHSMGEMASSYADGCISVENILRFIYERHSAIQGDVANGKMAAVGMSHKDLEKIVPPGVSVACHNAPESSTISGADGPMDAFMEELKAKGIFVKFVPSMGKAYHCKMIQVVVPHLQKTLGDAVPKTRRSSKWLSTSLPPSEWDTEKAREFSVDYFCNNLISPVFFEEAVETLPKDSVVVEIGPHGLLQSLIKMTMGSDIVYTSLMRRNKPDNVLYCHKMLGTLYANGVDMKPLKLFPPVTYPVPKGTPMISPVISKQWDHSDSFRIPSIDDVRTGGDSHKWELDMSEGSPDRYLLGHRVNGMTLAPGSLYVVMAWESLAVKLGTRIEKLPVVLENVKVLRATVLSDDGKVTLEGRVLNTGQFEICEGKNVVATGNIRPLSEAPRVVKQFNALDKRVRSKPPAPKPKFRQTREEIYLSFAIRGYEYQGEFRGIKGTDNTVTEIQWPGHWPSMLDSILQTRLYSSHSDAFMVNLGLETLVLDASSLTAKLDQGEEAPVVQAWYDEGLDYISSDVLKLRRFIPGVVERGNPKKPCLEEFRFVPYLDDMPDVFSPSLEKYGNLCLWKSVELLKSALTTDTNSLSAERKQELLNDLKEHSSKPSKADMDTNAQGHGLLKTLNKMAVADIYKERDTILSEVRNDLADDIILQSLTIPEILMPCLEIVKYNFPDVKRNILEIGASESQLYRYIEEQLRTQSGINYTAAFKTDPPSNTSEYGVKPLQWDPSTGQPAPSKEIDLLVLSNVLHKQANLKEAFESLLSMVVPSGFILIQEVTQNFPIQLVLEGISEEDGTPNGRNGRKFGRYLDKSSWEKMFSELGLELLYRKSDQLLNTLFLLRKKPVNPLEPVFVNVSDLECSWLQQLQKEMAVMENEDIHSGRRLWLVADTPINGVTGFLMCLRKEPGGDKVRSCLLSNLKDLNYKPDLSPEGLNKRVVSMDLYQNMFRDGQHGFMARLPLQTTNSRQSKVSDAYVGVAKTGNLNSVQWVLSRRPLLTSSDNGSPIKQICDVYYATVVDKDVKLANGLMPHTEAMMNRHNAGWFGTEFAGRDSSGKRIMGLSTDYALSSSLNTSKSLYMDIPDHWTMEQAVSVPLDYLSVYYGLVVKCPVQSDQRILVLDGSSTMGQAVIQVLQSRGCEVYTTIDSNKKRDFLKAKFPNMADTNILDTRDCSVFLALAAGINQGVETFVDVTGYHKDSDVTLQALKYGGQFIQIAPHCDTDLTRDIISRLEEKEASYVRIDILSDLVSMSKTTKDSLRHIVTEDIYKGVLKPCDTTLFETGQLVEAFLEAESEHFFGKVVLKLREEESQKICTPRPLTVTATNRVTFDPERCYVITGGTGGFGLELTHWMVQRGAKKVVLTSRSGIKNGYQEYKLGLLANFYKATIRISNTIIKDLDSAKQLLKESSSLAPVGGIFLLSMVLNDRLLQNQTRETFMETVNAKVKDCLYLDQASREMCGRELEWFVPFSSAACGRGIVSQSNYGFGNSVMERICERRKRDGLAALAIQWGAVGNVGAYMSSNVEDFRVFINTFAAFGMEAQPIASCLGALDTFLFLKDQAVVSSCQTIDGFGKQEKAAGQKSLLNTVAKIFGVSDPNKLDNNTALASMGLDSLISIEVKQVLERDFDMVLDMGQIRELTFGKIRQIDSDNADA